MTGITVKLDAASFIQWAKNLSDYKLKLALKNALNRASRAARTTAIEVIAADEGVSSARAKKSISALATASPSRLVTTWNAAKQRIGIMNTSGAKWTRGVGLTASTHRITGGGSASLNVAKAFVIQANGGTAIVIRKGKGKAKGALKGLYAENPSTALGQADGAARLVWLKTAEVRLKQELNMDGEE